MFLLVCMTFFLFQTSFSFFFACDAYFLDFFSFLLLCVTFIFLEFFCFHLTRLLKFLFVLILHSTSLLMSPYSFQTPFPIFFFVSVSIFFLDFFYFLLLYLFTFLSLDFISFLLLCNMSCFPCNLFCTLFFFVCVTLYFLVFFYFPSSFASPHSFQHTF